MAEQSPRSARPRSRTIGRRWRLGAVRGLPEIYRAAGATLSFDRGLIGELVTLVEEHIDRLRQRLTG